MHRLLSVRNIYRSGLHGVTSSNTVGINAVPSNIKCSFCRKVLLGRPNLEILAFSRHQSTRTAKALQKLSKKKSKYKNIKKYGEVLEVGDQTMTETKISISKLNAKNVHKLASSPVSLNDLYQLTSKTPKKHTMNQIDPELLQKFRDKILNKPRLLSTNTINPAQDDDKCALIFTNHTITSIEDKLNAKEFLDQVKDSYYNFRKATLYDQKLRDLHSAINEGINQEFDLTPEEFRNDQIDMEMKKGPHAMFREIFFDNNLDNYDHEFMAHLNSMQSQGIEPKGMEDFYDEAGLHSELGDTQDCVEIDNVDLIPDAPKVKGLTVKKTNKQTRAKKKAKRDKARARQEENMKERQQEIEARGKQDSWHRLLQSHLELLCSLHMTKEAHKVLQYFRTKGMKRTVQIKVVDVNIYNTLLHGFAAKDEYAQAEDLFAQMEQDNIVANEQTYAAMFEAIERSSTGDKMRLLNSYKEKMDAVNISLNDLIDKTTFARNQREIVLRAIKRLEPSFTPVYTPPELDYVCPILHDLKLDNIENRLGLNKSPAEGLLTVDEMKAKVKKQLQIEMDGEIVIENIAYKEDTSPNVVFGKDILKEIESEWRRVIREALIRDLCSLKSQSNASHMAISLYPYLTVLSVDQFVDLIMSEINNLREGSEMFSPTLKFLHRELGTQVFHKYQLNEYRASGVLDKLERVLDEYCEWYVRRRTEDGRPLNSRQAWQMLLHKHRDGPSLDVKETPWPIDIRQNIGKFLYNIIINDVKINVNLFKKNAKPKYLPAVYKVHRSCGRQFRLEVKPLPALMKLWRLAAPPTLTMKAPLAPMCCVPAPWRQVHAKPYLLTYTPIIRMPVNVVQQWIRLEEAPAPTLYPVMDSLNQLGEVPWVINKPILDLQLEIFKSGGNKKLDIAPPPSALDLSQFAKGDGPAAAYRRRLAVARARSEMYSLWCDALYKLSLANHYRDSVFWLPHNMDFRGRVYAVPPHVSQLGADAARALLQFARREPLGAGGLRWLMLHAVNLTGTMKNSTIEERLAYAESVLPLILDSAERPLDGAGWWMKAEDPWQTLAACMEIANAMKHPNPEEYLCGFPVQQDGSCNGLQHYAALGHDARGAAAVNLAPGPRPQDVYTALAHRIEEVREKDAAAGVAAAQALAGFVRRKVIKQTVMTTVYGVTRFGARLQIARQLKDIEEFPKDQVWTCSQYLTARTFESLREMFTSAKLIQDWFTDCAKLISSVCGASVEWETPLGLPVVQPYFKPANPAYAAQGNTPVDHQKRPCTIKQRNAFPPNFIHSLDSTHMMLTALRCQAAPEGITFISVHDCFWTHVRTVDAMNRICREQFVALHSQPILEDLSKYLTKRFGYPSSELEEHSKGAAVKQRVNTLLTQVPSKGEFDLQNVLKSVYFFS